jgi:hypothetical protein
VTTSWRIGLLALAACGGGAARPAAKMPPAAPASAPVVPAPVVYASPDGCAEVCATWLPPEAGPERVSAPTWEPPPPAPPPLPPESVGGRGAIEGTVTSTDGAPLDATIVAVCPGDSDSVVADDAGRFRLVDLPPGTCELVVYAGYAKERRDVTVTTGAVTRADVTIELRVPATPESCQCYARFIMMGGITAP